MSVIIEVDKLLCAYVSVQYDSEIKNIDPGHYMGCWI